MFIERERERERTRMITRENTQGRGRERIPSRLRTVSIEPDVGLDPRNREIMA